MVSFLVPIVAALSLSQMTRPLQPQFSRKDVDTFNEAFSGGEGWKNVETAVETSMSQGLMNGLSKAADLAMQGKDRRDDLRTFEKTFGFPIAPGFNGDDEEQPKAEESLELKSPDLEIKRTSPIRTLDGDPPPENPYDPYGKRINDDFEQSIEAHANIDVDTEPKAQSVSRAITPAAAGKYKPSKGLGAADSSASSTPLLFESEQALISPAAGKISNHDPKGNMFTAGHGLIGNGASVLDKKTSTETPEEFGGPTEWEKRFHVDTKKSAMALDGVELLGPALDLSQLNNGPDPATSFYREEDISIPNEENNADVMMETSKRIYRNAHASKRHKIPVLDDDFEDHMVQHGSHESVPVLPRKDNPDLQRLLQTEDRMERRLEEQAAIQTAAPITAAKAPTKRTDYRRGFDEGQRIGYRIYKGGVRKGFETGYSDAYQWAMQTFSKGYKKGFAIAFPNAKDFAAVDKKVDTGQSSLAKSYMGTGAVSSSSESSPTFSETTTTIESSGGSSGSSSSGSSNGVVATEAAVIAQRMEDEQRAEQAAARADELQMMKLESPEFQLKMDQLTAQYLAGDDMRFQALAPPPTGPPGAKERAVAGVMYVDPVNPDDDYGVIT